MTCVHTLVPDFLLTLLLCEGLAEHLLLELSARLTIESVTYDTDTKIELMDNIRVLIICADGVNHNIGASNNVNNYIELLERFTVGTEKRTYIPKGKIDKLLICEIRNLPKESATKTAIIATNAVGVNNSAKKEKVVSKINKRKNLNISTGSSLSAVIIAPTTYVPKYDAI